MRRRAFDKILTAMGVAFTVLLVSAGALLMVGHNFSNNTVQKQLAEQQIFFPPAGPAYEPQALIGKYIGKYAGLQLTTGPQARDYANHFIAVHVAKIANGQTYAQVSALAQADPKNAALQGQVAALFKGETLRGLLLNAYGWWELGQLALWGAIVSFVLGGVMFLLSVLGLMHLRRVSPETDIFVDLTAKTHTPALVGGVKV